MDGESRLRPLARAVLRTQSDHRLVALSREGRESAFDEIVRRYRPGLVAFAAAYAPSDAAEDVVQESLTSAWRSVHESDTEIELKPWLYTIVRNRALNARRDARPHEQLTEELDGVRRPDEIALTNEELGRAVAAVGALPEPQRRALVRSALDGRTHDQIAAELGSTPGAVGQLVFRARAALRAGLGVLIPLPLIRLLLEPAGPAAAGATGAGAAAAAGGASVLAKGAVVALIGVAAVGSGVAIDRATKSKDEPVVAREHSGEPAAADQAETGTGDDRGGGEHGSGDDRGGGPGPSGGHRSDEGSGGDHGGESGSSGPSASSGPSSQSGGSASSGSGSSGSGSGDSGDSGHDGGGGSGSSGSGSSGSGSSGSGGGTTTTAVEQTTTTTTTETEPLVGADDHSGSGSGSGSSGTGGSSGPD